MAPFAGHTGHCEVFFKLITQFKAGFGERFDDIPFIRPCGSIITGAELRHARSGCELWEARGWHWVCGCRKEPSGRLRFIAHGDEAGLAEAGYRVALGDGSDARGKSNGSAHSLNMAEAEAAGIEAVELPDL